jgi:hypothetical protein
MHRFQPQQKEFGVMASQMARLRSSGIERSCAANPCGAISSSMKTHTIRCFSSILAVSFLFSISTSSGDEQERLQREFAQKTKELAKDYSRKLQTLSTELTKRGNLDGALAVKKESEWATQAAKNWKAVLDKRGGGDSLDADFLAGDWIRQPDNVKHQITRDGKAAQDGIGGGYENGTWLVKGDLVYFLYSHNKWECYKRTSANKLTKLQPKHRQRYILVKAKSVAE